MTRFLFLYHIDVVVQILHVYQNQNGQGLYTFKIGSATTSLNFSIKDLPKFTGAFYRFCIYFP